jgi:hypothetical protein
VSKRWETFLGGQAHDTNVEPLNRNVRAKTLASNYGFNLGWRCVHRVDEARLRRAMRVARSGATCAQPDNPAGYTRFKCSPVIHVGVIRLRCLRRRTE